MCECVHASRVCVNWFPTVLYCTYLSTNTNLPTTYSYLPMLLYVQYGTLPPNYCTVRTTTARPKTAHRLLFVLDPDLGSSLARELHYSYVVYSTSIRIIKNTSCFSMLFDACSLISQYFSIAIDKATFWSDSEIDWTT